MQTARSTFLRVSVVRTGLYVFPAFRWRSAPTVYVCLGAAAGRRYARLHEMSRVAEAERLEQEMMATVKNRRARALANLKRMQEHL